MMSSPAQAVGALGAAVDTATDLPLHESPQAQIDHLQKLVSTLMQRMQDQEDAFELERLTWEVGDEHHDEEEAKPPLRMEVGAPDRTTGIGRPLRTHGAGEKDRRGIYLYMECRNTNQLEIVES